MFEPALVLAPLCLVAVLVLSALAKLADRASTLSVVRNLRLPRLLWSRWLPLALPLGELALAVGLGAPSRPVAVLAAVGCVVLFTLYLLVVARAMTFDPRPSCGCFGRIGEHRITATTMWRNTLLVALAVLTLVRASRAPTLPSSLGALGAGGWLWVLMTVVTAALAVLILGRGPSSPERGRHRGRSLPADPAEISPVTDDDTDDDADGYVRRPVPHANVVLADGTPRTLHELATQRAALLVFVTCTCGSTQSVVNRFPQWRASLPMRLVDLHLVTTLERARLERVGITPPEATAYDHGGVAYRSFGRSGLPLAVLLGADGLLAGGPVEGLDEVEDFVADIRAELDAAQAELTAQVPPPD